VVEAVVTLEPVAQEEAAIRQPRHHLKVTTEARVRIQVRQILELAAVEVLRGLEQMERQQPVVMEAQHKHLQ
jgi:hypothetical protein